MMHVVNIFLELDLVGRILIGFNLYSYFWVGQIFLGLGLYVGIYFWAWENISMVVVRCANISKL